MKVDFVLSCGAACRPAYHARNLNLRNFSSPCDWMMNYSLDHFIDILRTEGKKMFRNAKYDTVNKRVYDVDNGMISMHDFNNNTSLDSQLPAFYEKMERRAKNTIKQISQSKCTGIIMNRKIEHDKLVHFANSMELLFPNTFFYIINIRDIPLQESLKTELIMKTKKYTITEISFNDAHANGRDHKTNNLFWLGNVQIWEQIMLQHFQIKWQYYKCIKRLIKKTISFMKKIIRKTKLS